MFFFLVFDVNTVKIYIFVLSCSPGKPVRRVGVYRPSSTMPGLPRYKVCITALFFIAFAIKLYSFCYVNTRIKADKRVSRYRNVVLEHFKLLPTYRGPRNQLVVGVLLFK